ncbi:HK97 family phage prohead protease [Vannielia litorea]|uniref:HK97 family phage prohead protease n=1 Tax=Vannielia litorea TaxID=1217970 RepID=UPI001C97803E|nr:HK97 family phage prohead protease [Vannielia litorea]MBY6152545.1 HK97 family phage prohead protease [Vannielia litorea]
MAMDYGPELEHKFCAPEAKLAVDESYEISGYASLFGAPDQGGDVVVAGAYARSLKAMAAKGQPIRMLWQHDPREPIGIWDEVREDRRGLWVKGRLLKEVARAREAAALINAGAIDGLSIGYRTKRAEKDAQGRRLLHDLELWEVSLVTFPMLREARLSGAKGDELPPAADEGWQELAEALRAARRALAG